MFSSIRFQSLIDLRKFSVLHIPRGVFHLNISCYLFQGVFAVFDVQILSQTYPGVFQVEPASGQNSAQFSLFIVKPEYLDYEVPEYRTQQLTVLYTTKYTPPPSLFVSSRAQSCFNLFYICTVQIKIFKKFQNN